MAISMFTFWRAFWVFSFIIIFVTDSKGITVKVKSVPTLAEYGRSVTLICDYDLEGDKFYAITWFKDYQEIFAFSPSQFPPKQVFPLENVFVDESRSNGPRLLLKNLNLGSSGEYKCVVTGATPELINSESSHNMSVVALPQSSPTIDFDETLTYDVGDILNIACISSPSYPPTALTIYVNDIHVGSVETQIDADIDPIITHLRLQFPLTKFYLNTDVLIIKCVAKIPELYHSITTSYSEKRDSHNSGLVLA